MNGLRKLHLYLGILFAPSIIFFAFTGALQTFGLHEARHGESTQPPAWIQKLAAIHKDQRIRVARRPADPATVRPAGNTATAPAGNTATSPTRPASSKPLKWFVLVMSVGLITTTVLGIIMAFKYNRGAALIWTLLALGVVIPLVLLVA